MRSILLLPNERKDPGLSVSREITSILRSHGATVLLPDEIAGAYPDIGALAASTADAHPELLIAVGGDGTVLAAAGDAMRLDLPLLGINMGHLGFLAELETDQLSLLSGLFCGNYRIVRRMTLSVSVEIGGVTEAIPISPLNDVSFSHDRGNGLAELTLTDSDGNSIDYHADGLILATPSGSTAYTLSAGGPIIDDTVEAICVTPVCPHSFFNRSVIFGRDSVLTVTNRSRAGNEVIVALDGTDVLRLPSGGSLTVRRSESSLKMLSFDRHATIRTLNRKMQMADMKYRVE